MSSIWAKGCMLMIVCCYLTWHDYPSLVEGESHGILLLLLLLQLLLAGDQTPAIMRNISTQSRAW